MLFILLVIGLKDLCIVFIGSSNFSSVNGEKKLCVCEIQDLGDRPMFLIHLEVLCLFGLIVRIILIVILV